VPALARCIHSSTRPCLTRADRGDKLCLQTLRVVLLDVDGTLVASNESHARAWVDALAEFGFAIPVSQMRPLIGMGGDKILPRVHSNLDEEHEPGKSIVARRLSIFLERYAPRLKATPGATALLDRFGERGLLRVAATSANETEFKAIVEAAGIKQHLDLWTTADDADRSKPDPDIVQSALAKAKMAKSEALFIGDTPYDIEAAHRTGVPIVALQCGGWSEPNLAGAEAVYETPAHLLREYEDSIIVTGWSGKEVAPDFSLWSNRACHQ